MKTAFLIFTIFTPLFTNAQPQSQAQCAATVRARTSFFNDEQIKTLCKDNKMDVVNCTVTQMQGSRMTGTFEKSLDKCRMQWDVKVPKPSPSPSATGSAAPAGPTDSATKEPAKVKVPAQFVPVGDEDEDKSGK